MRAILIRTQINNQLNSPRDPRQSQKTIQEINSQKQNEDAPNLQQLEAPEDSSWDKTINFEILETGWGCCIILLAIPCFFWMMDLIIGLSKLKFIGAFFGDDESNAAGACFAALGIATAVSQLIVPKKSRSWNDWTKQLAFFLAMIVGFLVVGVAVGFAFKLFSAFASLVLSLALIILPSILIIFVIIRLFK